MSHGADGNASHGGSAHGPGNHSMHSLGREHGFNSGHSAFGLGGHHAGSAMHAALNSSSHAAGMYGSHSIAMVYGTGMLASGHVINTVSTSGPVNHDGGGHVDGPGANRQSPKDLRIKDIKGANLLVAHAVGLVDHGSGFYGDLLDSIAKGAGLMRIDSRPNLKGEDSLNLDGIMPWNAWGNPMSKTGPDGYEPLLRGTTDKIIHIFAIPTMDRKKKVMHVSPDETITVTVRMTVWHYAQTADAEVKIEFIVNSPYVFDKLQSGRYTTYGKRTERLEVVVLKLAKELFASLTAPSEHADPAPRAKYVRSVNRFPDRKGRPQVVTNTHPDGVHVGTEAEREEVESEEVAEIKKEDRDSENQVAGATVPGVATTPTVTSDDDSDLTGPNGTAGAVVWGPPTPPTPTPAPAPAPTPVPKPTSGTFTIPVDLK
jgi:hypothetical protein